MTTQNTHSAVLIIGGGPAGITFSRNLRKLRPDLSITMLRPEEHSMIYCAIPYAVEGLFEPHKTFKKDEMVTDVGVNLVRRHAREVDLRARRVVDEAGDTYTADVIYIATGGNPILPPLPGSDAANVYTVKTQEDMEALITRVRSGAGRAVVVGAGAIGIEQAQAYRSRGLEVYLVDLAPHVLPAMLDEDMVDGLHAAIREKGINLILSARVERIEKTGDRARQVVLSDGQAIDIDPDLDFICFAVGVKASTALFQGQGLEEDRDGIIVDNRMRTSLPGVYAAGDCCRYVSAIDGKPVAGKLATNAVPMAKIAARAVAGLDDEYGGFLNGAATCFHEMRIASTGFTAAAAEQRGLAPVTGRAETTTLFPMMPGAGKVTVKLVADRRDLRIIGGQIISTLPATDKIDIITLAIQQRLTLKDLSGLSYSAQPWQSYMPASSAIVAACEDALDSFKKKEGWTAAARP